LTADVSPVSAASATPVAVRRRSGSVISTLTPPIHGTSTVVTGGNEHCYALLLIFAASLRTVSTFYSTASVPGELVVLVAFVCLFVCLPVGLPVCLFAITGNRYIAIVTKLTTIVDNGSYIFVDSLELG